MKKQIHRFVIAVGALCLAGCASSSLKQAWKSPTYTGGPVQKIAVLAVDERGLVRQGFENRFVRDLQANGQAATTTFELMSLAEIKADKEAASARLQAAGVDTVLLIRLVDRATYSREVRATPERWVPTVSGFETCGWYDCYSVAFLDMSTTWSSTKQEVFLESSLFDLKASRRLWSAQTETELKEDTDRLAEADSLIAKIVAAIRQDGLVR